MVGTTNGNTTAKINASWRKPFMQLQGYTPRNPSRNLASMEKNPSQLCAMSQLIREISASGDRSFQCRV